MWALLLVVLVQVVQASAQSPPVVPFAQDYKTSLVKYAVVDRSDGLSRDLYASRDAIDAVKRNPRLQEFPAGVLFAFDVYSARLVGRDRKTQTPIFEATPQGHLVRSKDERSSHPLSHVRRYLRRVSACSLRHVVRSRAVSANAAETTRGGERNTGTSPDASTFIASPTTQTSCCGTSRFWRDQPLTPPIVRPAVMRRRNA